MFKWTKFTFGYLFSAVPLGSIQELPAAKSCAEIKASKGKEMAEVKHWTGSTLMKMPSSQSRLFVKVFHFNFSR